jgi:hypothetical protein
MLGTPRYISPEQARGVDVDHRADIYSLGVMAYEMLAGRAPFNAETAMDLVVMHLNEAPPQLSLFAKVPKALEHCVMRMLEKEPAKRPSLPEVRNILVDPSRRLTPMPSRLMQAVTPRTANRWPFVAAGIGAMIVGLLVTWRLVGSSTPDAPPPAPPPVVAAPVVAPPKAEPVIVEVPAIAPVAPVAVDKKASLGIEVKGPNATAAAIFVDGVRWGTGTSGRLVPPGKHHVVVKPPGGAAMTNDVEVAADENKSIEFQMQQPVIVRQTAPAARPPKQPKPPPVVAPNDDELMKPKKH